jgi:Ca-activated chloride channel family protein
VSFAAPLVLLGLLALPALVVWYGAQQRDRRRAAAAFAAPRLAASVTPHRPGWRPLVLLGAAMSLHWFGRLI